MSDIAAGWYPDEQGLQRWWDGYQWTEHVAMAQVPVPRETPRSAVPSPSYAQPIIVNSGVRFYKTSHTFHLIMSVVTLGAWLPVWAVMAIYNSARSN